MRATIYKYYTNINNCSQASDVCNCFMQWSCKRWHVFFWLLPMCSFHLPLLALLCMECRHGHYRASFFSDNLFNTKLLILRKGLYVDKGYLRIIGSEFKQFYFSSMSHLKQFNIFKFQGVNGAISPGELQKKPQTNTDNHLICSVQYWFYTGFTIFQLYLPKPIQSHICLDIPKSQEVRVGNLTHSSGEGMFSVILPCPAST